MGLCLDCISQLSDDKMVEHSTEITEDEAALYDRQIRLWGLDAQKKLRACRVLLVGLKGLGAEIAKNLVLAGIKSLTLLDTENVNEEDLCSQFLVTSDDLGKNRAQSSLLQAQQLNPMVEMKADVESLSQKSHDFFVKFDVVILTNATKEEIIRVDKICREINVKFFAGDVYGFFGYSFENLHNYSYIDEIKVVTQELNASDKKIPQETKLLKKEISFSSFKAAVDKDWSSENCSKQLKTLSSSYFILQTLLQFRAEKGCRPALNSDDSTELSSLNDQLLEKMGVGKDRVNSMIFNSIFAELSPVCAVVGGVLAQEVVKAVTCKDTPHNNFFFYNALENNGIVEKVGDE